MEVQQCVWLVFRQTYNKQLIRPRHSKAFFATILLSYAAKSLDILRKSARGAKDHKPWNLLQTLKEPLIRSDGKSLAQGQVALIDPT